MTQIDGQAENTVLADTAVVPDSEADTKEATVALSETVDELITVAGVITEQAGSIDPVRLARVSDGRRQVALKTLLRGDRSYTGEDIYVACVCYGTFKRGIKVSDLVFSGSSEARICFEETASDQGEVHAAMTNNLIGTCVLILNPIQIRKDVFQVPSQKSCLKLGNLSGLISCDSCDKPVLLRRDGTLCAEHAAARCSVRSSIGGTMLVQLEETKTEENLVKAVPLTNEERRANADEAKRQSLVAKKKAVTLLYNRRNSLLSGGDLKLDHRHTDGKGEMDIGGSETVVLTDLADKLLSFKRKREDIARMDAMKLAIAQKP